MLKVFLQKKEELSHSINNQNFFLLSSLLLLPVFIAIKQFTHNLPIEILVGFTVLGAVTLIFCQNKFTGKDKKRRLNRSTANWFSLLFFTLVLCVFIVIDEPKWWLRILEDSSLPVLAGTAITLLLAFIVCFSIGKLNTSINDNYKPSKLTDFVSAVYMVGLITFAADISQQELGLLIAVVLFILSWINICIMRFHDLNRSGRDCFGLLVPFYNIYLLYQLLFIKGIKGTNKYGPDPLVKPKTSQPLLK